jgi:hypothetical protein
MALTLDNLANALRGVPRSAPVYVRTTNGLKLVAFVRLIRAAGDGQQTEHGAGQTGIVLEA